jgi:hypothetical protein
MSEEPWYEQGTEFVDRSGIRWCIHQRWLNVDADDIDRQYEYVIHSETLEQIRVDQLSLTAMMRPVDGCS